MTSLNSNGVFLWRPFLSSYAKEDLTALTFPSKPDLHKAFDLIWSRLRGMPFGIPGYNSLIVPRDAVQCFSDAGLKFDESPLLNVADLTPDELAEYHDR